MKLVFTKSNLNKAVGIVMKAVPTRTTMNILECILIDATTNEIKFTGNDMELGIETIVEGEIIEKGKVAIDAKLFSEIVRKLPDNDITLSTDSNNNALITCEKSKFNIAGKSGEDFSYLPAIIKDKMITLSQFQLREVINQTIFSIAMNDNNKMRRFIICLFFILAFNISDAQNKNRHFTPERFQAELEQYITRKAGLSPKEASEFFPLYSEMLRKQRSIHDELKKLKRIKPTTDAECKKNLMKRDKCEIEIKQLQKTYHEKFMQILPAGKVYDIVKAEERFHRQIFKRAADKMRHKKK